VSKGLFVGDREWMFRCALCEYLSSANVGQGVSKGAGVISRCVSKCARTR
jgi:hypothetical protein